MEIQKHMSLLLLVCALCVLINLKFGCGSVIGDHFNRSCIESEKQALLLLKKSFVDDWNSLSSWDDDDCCSWQGIVCNKKTGQVNKLNRSSHGLKGFISESIGNLTALTVIDLSDNSIEGIIPESIGALTSLTELDLHFNNLQGSIPQSIGALTSLTSLRLSVNKIGGMIPESIGALTSLTSLDLSHNKIGGMIPESIGALTSLTSLRLSVNKIGGMIPESIEIGSLPVTLNNLTSLQVLELQNNQLTGSLPSLSGLSSLQTLLLHHNQFVDMPTDFFNDVSSLQSVYIGYNAFNEWQLPDSLKSVSTLQKFSATSCNITGKIPDFFGSDTFVGLTLLDLAFNSLEGELPVSFSGSLIQTLWLNGQKSESRLYGSIAVLQNMTELTEIWLHSNSFSGPIPDLSGLGQLQNLSLRDNSLTGIVPVSVIEMPALVQVNLTNNMLQGPTPKFKPSVHVDMVENTNSFCLNDPGAPCDSRVNVLLAIAESVGYPNKFAENWKGNDPCLPWLGLTCNDRNITVINFQKMGLAGSISPNFSFITSLQRLILANNNLTGVIPNELTSLVNLKELDISNNQLHGKVPSFRSNVIVKIDGNVDIGKDSGPSKTPTTPTGKTPGSSPGSTAEAPQGGNSKSSTGVVVGSVVGGVCAFVFAGFLVVCLYRTKRKRSGLEQHPGTTVIHPRHSGSDQDAVKITVTGSSVNGGSTSETLSLGSSGPRDMHIVEAGNMVISIQVLRNVTNNFSQDNILGKGGFGTVYSGELHDGTKIAVKRMESGVMSEKGLDEFKSEIAVLTKVRHRNLVVLLGYCLDGNERLLVYEYMPQGTLSRYLFDWEEEGLKPLEWSKRLTIALDVARGVEYLHGLAQQSFIHRDLKPSNILLGDDMRAKVADFGLVRLAPDGKASLVTRLAGTFGYLAPEYAVTGRVTTKIDVFSFGVILMELITGRRALDETQEEDSVHLVPWFRRMHLNKETFRKAIDPTIVLDEEALVSISTIAELAGHCCAREPHQRPDMNHAVNVLSSLAELWKPSDPDPDDIYGIDLDITLPQAVKKWQALEGMSGMDYSSSGIGSSDNTQTSIPTRPSGFADSFTSSDGR